MALCKLATIIAPHRREEVWGWLKNGQVRIISDSEVIRIFLGVNDSGLDTLSTEPTHYPPVPVVETDIAPLRVGQYARAAPVLYHQEIWAAGVTYESSKFARMSESEAGGDFYARVYTADRPELFFKATASRAVGHRDTVNIRSDATWSVPEPELAVVANARGRILGYTIGNDMSSRDIEGANPLYLPQAKIYTRSCALGPWIVPEESIDPRNVAITLTIERDGQTAFEGTTSTSRMKRSPEELIDWLFRDNEFPHGVILLTGTGVIPPDNFTLAAGDNISIQIEGIGVLQNRVAIGEPLHNHLRTTSPFAD
jgi:2-dehydro-3-deoxy-D-arabinonate dehydratase